MLVVIYWRVHLINLIWLSQGGFIPFQQEFHNLVMKLVQRKRLSPKCVVLQAHRPKLPRRANQARRLTCKEQNEQSLTHHVIRENFRLKRGTSLELDTKRNGVSNH